MHHIPEGRGIFSTLSVEENLRLQLLSAPRSRRRTLMAEAFERFEILGQRRDVRAGSLSGGQQRLLALAGAIVSPPSLLIADELSLGLAPNVLDEVYAALASIRDAGAAILVIEQQVARSLRLADVAAVIDHGSIAYSGPSAGATRILESILSGGPVA
jgi:branched-chain amino acid transport system ATP-binding protein